MGIVGIIVVIVCVFGGYMLNGGHLHVVWQPFEFMIILGASLGGRKWSIGTDATNANYTDWKIGVTKDISGWVLGAAYQDTNAKGGCNPANTGYYCFGNSLPVAAAGTKFKDAGKGVVVFSVSKSF